MGSRGGGDRRRRVFEEMGIEGDRRRRRRR